MADIEFYVGTSNKHIAVLVDSAVPRKGEHISIRRAVYLVKKVTWAVDHADKISGATLRANVVLTEV